MFTEKRPTEFLAVKAAAALLETVGLSKCLFLFYFIHNWGSL